MGNSEGDKPAKSEKAASPPREQSSVHVYPDWASVQAYYGPGAMPPPYYNTAVTAGHAAQPYMWGPPHMMAPYGSPYAAMYPHGGIYGPAPTPVVTPVGLDTPEKSFAKDSGSGKTTKEPDANAGGVTGNGNANVDSAGEGGGRGRSQSSLDLECRTEGSCDISEDSTSREANGNRSCNGAMAIVDTGTCNMQMNSVVPGIPMATVKPVVSSPMPPIVMNHFPGATATAPCAPRSSGIGIQDERELKREKRKQSNRESARRSRLRKQSEMEELGKKVDSLNVENMALRSEINKLVEDSEKLRSENAALMDKLKIMQGQEEMGSEAVEDQEKSQINTENLISRVDNTAANGVHEQDEPK